MKSKNKIYFGVGLVVIILLIAVISLFSAPKTEETIKIGAVLPLSGAVSYWGQPVQKGMQLAVNEINSKGGINGKQVELIFEDSKADPTTGVNAVNKLLDIDNVLTVIVHTTGVSNAVAPVVEEKQVPWIADAADTGLPLKYKYAFKSFYNAYDECKKLVTAATNRGLVKYGLLLPNMPWGDWCAKGVKEVVGEENTVDLSYTFRETDFRTLLLKAKENNVSGIVWIGFPFESDAINKQKAELGIKIPLLCGYGHECVSDSSLQEVPEEYLEGYLIFDFDLSDDFRNNYVNELSSSEIIPAAFGYDEVNVIASALENCEDLSRDCLYKNLLSVKDYPTALKSNGFDDMKNLKINTALYELRSKEFVPLE